MPQLDKVTFLTQYFWLCIVFFSLYLILVKFFLPAFARIVQVRPAIAASSEEAPTVDSNPAPTKNGRLISLVKTQSVVRNHANRLISWIEKSFKQLEKAITSNFVPLYKKMVLASLSSQNIVRHAMPPITWLQPLSLQSELFQKWISAKAVNKKKSAKTKIAK